MLLLFCIYQNRQQQRDVATLIEYAVHLCVDSITYEHGSLSTPTEKFLFSYKVLPHHELEPLGLLVEYQSQRADAGLQFFYWK